MTPGFKIRSLQDRRQAKLTKEQKAGEGASLDTCPFSSSRVKSIAPIQQGESDDHDRRDLLGGQPHELDHNMEITIGNPDVQCIHWTSNLSFSLSPTTSTNVGVGRGEKTRFDGEDASTTRTALGFDCFNWSLLLLLLLTSIHYYYIHVVKCSNNSSLYTNCIQWDSNGGEC